MEQLLHNLRGEMHSTKMKVVRRPHRFTTVHRHCLLLPDHHTMDIHRLLHNTVSNKGEEVGQPLPGDILHSLRTCRGAIPLHSDSRTVLTSRGRIHSSRLEVPLIIIMISKGVAMQVALLLRLQVGLVDRQ